MSNINLKYKFVNEVSQDKILEKLDALCCDKYKVYVTIHDFSLGNTISTYFDDGKIQERYEKKNVIIKVVEENYEDNESKDEQELIKKDIIQYSDTIASLAVVGELTFEKGIFDNIDFDIFKDKDYGGIYTDYTIAGTECFLPPHPLPIKISIPTVFWSTAVFIRNIGRDEVTASIFNTSKILHVPKFSYTIEYKDEEKNVKAST